MPQPSGRLPRLAPSAACYFDDHRLEPIESLLKDAAGRGEADADVAFRAGPEPARSAGHESDTRALAQLLAQIFCIDAQCLDVREHDIGALRRSDSHPRPAGEPPSNVVALGV